MKELLTRILDALFPKPIDVEKLEVLLRSGDFSDIPSASQIPYPWIHTLFAYKNETVRALVWQIKYTGNNSLIQGVAKILADEVMAIIEDGALFHSLDWVYTEIPASKTHLKEKGFNQTEELCRAMNAHLDSKTISYMPYILQKVRETVPQAQMKQKSERTQNLVGTFSVTNPQLVSGKQVIVIDDVTTTGSTFVEAKRALLAAGAKEVRGLAIAH